MNKKFKKLVGLLAIMMLVLSVGSIGFATSSMVNLKAYYRDIKISKNGQQVQITPEPFIIDGSTYVPLRAVSELLDKEVVWDGANYKIDIKDMANSNVANLTQQLYTSQLRVAQLEKQVKDLEAKLKIDSSYDLDDLEDDLNDDYGSYKDAKFDIELSGSESKIKVEIFIDLNKYDDEWAALSEVKIEDYIEDIVDDIESQFEDATISGYIEDSYYDDELVSFTVKSNGSVSFDFDGTGSSSSLSDLEDDLNYDYDEYEGVDFDITLTGDEDDITVQIVADVDDIIDELGESDIENYLYDIYDDIMDVFEDASVSGYIKDDAGKLYFDFDSSGNVDLDWY